MNLDKLEKQIRGKFLAIKLKEITPQQSGIGVLFKYMKIYDEALYETLLKEYKEILNKIK